MEPQVPTDEPMADVFAFCNQLAWRVGGPVLMYGSAWSVVAYSTLNQGLDDIRRSIILRRVIPPDPRISGVRQSAEEHFEAGTSCFEIPDMPGIQTRRVIAPIRLLGVHVGSLWIAESAGDLHPDALQIAQEAAKQASFYFQLYDDARKREADRFTRMLLEGSQDELLLAQYLGVPVTANFRVISVCHGSNDDLRQQTRQVTRVLAARQSVNHVVLESEECLYVAFYVAEAGPTLNEATRSFVTEISSADDRLIVGAGRATTRLSHAPKSRTDADKVVAYLRRTPGQRVGSVNTLRNQMTLMRLVEILDSQFEPLPGTLQALSSLELDDREEALRTLDAFFTYPGNASEAARHLHVHPNTFRYRLAKVADILGIDLDDRDTRLVLELDLLRHRYGGINARRT